MPRRTRPLDTSTQHLLRELAPRVLGALTRRFGDFAAAEDAVQEALIAAATRWPCDGIPESPRAWLIRVASRRAADHLRSETARRRREALAASLLPTGDPFAAVEDENAEGPDDPLDLLFMCCHPALTPASAIALTLRAVGGLTTAEIAHAFLVPEATMAQRIRRAKQRIKAAGARFERPRAEDRAARLGAVMHVLYLIFSEGYAASSGPQLLRVDLSAEGLRLARMLRRLVPDDGEVTALLVLMVLTDARRAARTGPAGELIPLDRQDRALWDRDAVAEGAALLAEGASPGPAGPYRLQAAIAAVHDEAASWEDTDWSQILGLYGLLLSRSDNPMVALNHAVAAAMVHGPETGLELLDALTEDARLAGHHRLDAVRAHLLERAGDHEAAVEGYRRAAERTKSLAERSYLLLQVSRLRDTQG